MSLFNFIVDPDCPPDTVYIVNNKAFEMPVWVSEDGREFWNVEDIGNEHLRVIIDMLLREASKQYWYRKHRYKILFDDLERRGLWSDTDELKSRLVGVVKRKAA